MQTDNEKKLLGKLNAFSVILRLGHEAFEKASLKEMAMHIVNNSRAAIPFSSSCLADLSSNKIEILALSSQVEVNQNSEYTTNLKIFLKNIKIDSAQPLPIDAEFINNQNPVCAASFKKINPDAAGWYLVPLKPPRSRMDNPDLMLWLVKFKPHPQTSPGALLTLLGKHYAEALWSLQKQSKSYFKRAFRRKFTPGICAVVIFLSFLVSLFTIHVRQDVTANFSIRPEHELVTFAWYDGIIKECLLQDGSKVKKGNVILRYDTRQLRYRLAAAQADCSQAKAEYEKVSSEAFTRKEQLGNIKLLQIKQQRAEIAIRECKWLLSKSVLRAPKDGILSLTAGTAEKLEGKAVKLGEKLFEVFSGNDLQAQIELDEKDASILDDASNATLYLHARPEVPLKAQIVFASSRPTLTERNTFCYLIDARINSSPTDAAEMRYGMRGTARLYGRKVTWGYYLFRSLVLWWRNI